MKKLLLGFLFLSAAGAATLTLATSDPRCSGTLTCTFQATETMPSDYGTLAITATPSGGGTWTIGSDTGAGCNNPLFAWFSQGTPTSVPPAVTSFSATTTIFLAPIAGNAVGCAVGSYTHTFTITNSISGTYTVTAIQVVSLKLANPLFLNGCGVTDASLSGGPQGSCPGGLSQAGAETLVYPGHLGVVPCSPACNPGGSFSMPGPGGTFIDEFGNTHRVISPVGPNGDCWASVSDAEKSAFNSNNTYVLLQNVCNGGNNGIFPTSGASAPSYSPTTSDLGNQTFAWDNTNPAVIYGVVGASPYSGNPTDFKEVVLGSAPAYTNFTAPGEPAGVLWRAAYATYGWFNITAFSHQDMNALNWFVDIGHYEYDGVASLTGTALVWVSGPLFDTQKFQDQAILIGSVVGYVHDCADNQHCTLTSSPGDQVSVVTRAQVPWKLCAFNPVQMHAQGASYTPLCVDLTALPRPHVQGTGSVSYISHGLDANGRLWIHHGNYPRGVVGYFNPSTDISITYAGNSWVDMPGASGNTTAPNNGYICGPEQSAASAFGSVLTNYCYTQPHGAPWADSSGRQWLSALGNGRQVDTFLFSANSQVQIPLSASSTAGTMFIPFWGHLTTEASSARKAPYFLLSNSNDGVPLTWPVTSATGNGTPCIVTVTASSSTGINTTTHNKVLIGTIVGNTACNGHHTVTAVSGPNDNIWTFAANGNGTYTSGGVAVEDVAPALINEADADQMFLIRDVPVIEIRRFGRTRSIGYDGGYYTLTRASLSMDAKYAIYTTNNGEPGNSLRAVIVTTGITNGIGMTSEMFDLAHSVTSATAAGSVATISFNPPDTANYIVEIGPSRRFSDCPGFTALGCAPYDSTDPGYQHAVDSTGINPRVKAFTITPGVPYYYRVSSNKYAATGQLSAASASTLRGVVFGGAVLR